MWCKKVLCISSVLCCLWSFALGQQCEVKLKSGYGSVQGYGLLSKTPKGDPLCSYLGIPYAKPPVGELRFEPPQPIDLSRYASSWAFNVKSPICIQNSILHNRTDGQENCLFLNVYSKPSKWVELRPVIVWLHGGWFQTGSAYTRGADHPDYLVDEDTIFVTLNYRLGALGFLHREGDDIVGNLGLRDQLEALRWIHANIAAFGGNPQKVTLFGWSSGSASIAYHLQAPSSRGLFHGAIMMSGSSLNPWAYERHSRACVKILCETLNIPCSQGQLKNVLKRIPASIFGSPALNLRTMISYFGEPIPCFVPTGEINEAVYGTAMVQSAHQQLISQPVVSDVPLIIGHNVAETWMNYRVNRQSLPRSWNYSFTNTADKIVNPLRRYLLSGTKELNNRSKKIAVDATLIHGVKDFAEYYTTNADSNIYFYRFSHKHHNNEIGALHGDELPYIFGTLDEGGKLETPENPEDEMVRMTLVRYIADFAKFR